MSECFLILIQPEHAPIVSGNMAVDDVDGMKSSVETYRTCTDKENTEPLYAKITKKKSARYNTYSTSQYMYRHLKSSQVARTIWTSLILKQQDVCCSGLFTLPVRFFFPIPIFFSILERNGYNTQ